MFRRLVIVASAVALLAIMGSASNSSATDRRDRKPTLSLPGAGPAARAVDDAAEFLYGLSNIPGASIGGNITCGAANVLWALAGRPRSTCGKESAARRNGTEGLDLDIE
ncbi:hypothetical protein Aph01nite_32290 [Acrocarpospora phusangensis]|uniref:Chaplin domain-containing protein n=1 Tax=Acrocarpospora phusangensis TaxID=1070424 RepID=A0A919UKD3_9ACTN|nr:hypothetical protein [Acrocarpospora phusangensis]GIH24919.1 hypothetical protein Aph01nite_32290 [Acrocarpospora phusangensis]